jgi:DNA-directed RNA polymerase specialized sigma24 family protein
MPPLGSSFRQRQIWLLHFSEHEPQGAIAKRLGVSRQAINQTLGRMRRRIEKKASHPVAPLEFDPQRFANVEI